MFSRRFWLVLILALNCFGVFGSGPTLVHNEVETLQQIGKTLGKTNWNFNVESCSGESGWITPGATKYYNNSVICNCSFADNTSCHIISIVLKRQNLSGVLPPELSGLPYLQEIDLSRNFLNGKIPLQWATLPLQKIALLGNRLSGSIPKEVGNITTLKELLLEANQFSGVLPPELGNLTNLKRLLLSSNNFRGELPKTLASLTNLNDVRLSDNHFTGRISDVIQNWTKLTTLELYASGLDGPIPSAISVMPNLTTLSISDINGTGSGFPDLGEKKLLTTLVLRNCNISGEVPKYLAEMPHLRTFRDLSFNKLVGTIPNLEALKEVVFMYFTSNLLTGPLPDWLLKKPYATDLSYNNFTWGSSGLSDCPRENVNLFESFSTGNSSNGVFHCSNTTCPQYYHSLHINCGGEEVKINKDATYEKDDNLGGASNFVLSTMKNWAFSSTGNFLDNNRDIDIYTATTNSRLYMPQSELYTTARLSPLSLTYYGLCLQNGNYTVKLHFAEIIFTDDKTYSSLGKRIFDVYIQGKLVLTDFNIKDEAGGSNKAVIKTFTVNVSSNSLEIHFYWGGKGTTNIPTKGNYGPLISAISVDPGESDKVCRLLKAIYGLKHSPGAWFDKLRHVVTSYVLCLDFPIPKDKKIPYGIIAGIASSVLCLVFLVLSILWRKGCLRTNTRRDNDLRDLDLQTGSFTLRQIKAATNNFDISNKIGEGGFGPVYKGLLSNGTIIAVKQLSSKSSQGNREFINEIGMISALQHPNLVKLYGCCIEGNQLLVVYEYMKNNSLARALFGHRECQLKLDWAARHKICVGVARGLAFLHEESRIKIVHRDIKATNILLDENLNPKISDFGLAKLREEDKTHINTRIAGTIGYMAPEYALRGYLTDKADVYSFGIVALEIVSGTSNTNYMPKDDQFYLLDWALVLKERGCLEELIDPKLGSEFNKEEAMGMINVALLCANSSPKLRPTMSAVVSMLEGRTTVYEQISSRSSFDLRLTASHNSYQQIGESSSENQALVMSLHEASPGSTPPASLSYTYKEHSASVSARVASLLKLWGDLQGLDVSISDINGTGSSFPDLGEKKLLRILVLRNCNISGEVPKYLAEMPRLRTFRDLSFNKLVGTIPNLEALKEILFMYFTDNLLSGHLPDWLLKKPYAIDLSYNNFTWGSSGISDCPRQNVNLFESFSTGNSSNGVCSNTKFPCPQYYHSLHINCGGEEVKINKDSTYEKDDNPGGASNSVLSAMKNWAFSSTGNFLDNDRDVDIYTATAESRLDMPNSELYTTARLSPLSLTYYGLCLQNGNYTVKLHFAEIIFTDDKTYSSLGKRLFDVYIQGKLVLKDFNIKDEAGGSNKAVIRNFTANVSSNNLEIRFYWGGKGTTGIPVKGTYGPLISAISVDPDFPIPKDKKIPTGIIAGVVASVLCLVFLVLSILWRKGCLRTNSRRDKDLGGLDLQTGSFTLRQIKAATNNFDISNKIGEGGFGSVYKGILSDGTIIAVKQLSSKSSQGNREFINEIGMVSALQHPHLVKLYGCCIEGNQLLVVYEYMKNNSLARALFGHRECRLKLDWATRHKICVGIARGLAFLHEESRIKIVHRDIKATNILLDENLNPKISDFGLAKLREEEKTHISTRIAGTIGYMAPEYALRGYLTDKADVYSFGIVALEIVSGTSNRNMPKDDQFYLLDWALVLKERGCLEELIDPKLGSEFNKEEVMGMINVALLCANTSPTLRPTMSAVVSMLEGRAIVQEQVSSHSSFDLRLKGSRKLYQQIGESSSDDHTLVMSLHQEWHGSSLPTSMFL
ncbi:putative LRR receptor-like serine/threonine-protein kinase At1g07650 [Tasmannia lanceolata]|uniref:putative LRR receptor-like serine/threonine-protein kinase At1g07650 n=1 Tax=Tasmannia lanceolata TaxID=3420 RepID=UPI004063D889